MPHHCFVTYKTPIHHPSAEPPVTFSMPSPGKVGSSCFRVPVASQAAVCHGFGKLTFSLKILT